jgi:hypothetical protein
VCIIYLISSAKQPSNSTLHITRTSTAQQARPKVIGHIEPKLNHQSPRHSLTVFHLPLRAQFDRSSILVYFFPTHLSVSSPFPFHEYPCKEKAKKTHHNVFSLFFTAHIQNFGYLRVFDQSWWSCGRSLGYGG